MGEEKIIAGKRAGSFASRVLKKGLTLVPVLFYEYYRRTNLSIYLEPIVFTKADNFSHKSHSIEWWYFTGILNSTMHKHPLGFEVTFFRIAALGEGRILHTAVTDVENGAFHNRSLNVAFYPTLLDHRDSRHVNSIFGNYLYYDQAQNKFHINTRIRDLTVNLEMGSGDIMCQGNRGVLDDSYLDGSSYYFSLPNLVTTGRISYGGNTCDVNGMTWHDHQWGNFRLREIAWEWFSLRFDEQELYIMVFVFKKAGGVIYSGNIMHHSMTQPINDIEVLSNDGIMVCNGFRYPSSWNMRIIVGNRRIECRIIPLVKDQSINSVITPSYWEGICSVQAVFPSGANICGSEFLPGTVLNGYAYTEVTADE